MLNYMMPRTDYEIVMKSPLIPLHKIIEMVRMYYGYEDEEHLDLLILIYIILRIDCKIETKSLLIS